MIVRVAGYAYQRGFGGHFHNDNSVAALRDIPGIMVATPSRADDAIELLRTCGQAAADHGAVSVIVEPIALYHTRDLHDSEDEKWLSSSPAAMNPGHSRVYGTGTDLTIITSGNAVPMSLRVANQLTSKDIHVRVVDLRWLAPLPIDDILDNANATGRVLIADETRASGAISESVVATLVDNEFAGRIKRVTSSDSFIPLGSAANLVLLSESEIEEGALSIVRELS